MRGWSLVWIAAAATAMIAVFVMKHEVRALEQELGGLNRQILANEDALHVLHAEWAYLNRPDRLERLGHDLLHLEPASADQIVTAAWLGLDQGGAPAPVVASSDPPDIRPEPVIPVAAPPPPPPVPKRRPHVPAARPKSNDEWIAGIIVALKDSQ